MNVYMKGGFRLIMIEEPIQRSVYVKGKYIGEKEISKIQFMILSYITKKEDYVTRYELMDMLKISGSTLHENLCKLVARGYLSEKLSINQKKGRPQHFYNIVGGTIQ